jgi:hypothetical protein
MAFMPDSGFAALYQGTTSVVPLEAAENIGL